MATLIPKFDLKNGGVSPTGAVNRNINLKLAESVSVTDFGADPTGVSDSTTAIQNAIASLPATGGTLNFPSGTYITDTIVFPLWPKAVYLIGNGRDSTTLVAKNPNSPIIQGATAVVPFYATSANYVYGFTFKANAGGSTGPALNLAICSFSKFENIGFALNGTGAWTYGFLLDADDHCYSNVIQDVKINNSTPVTDAVIYLENHANLHWLRNIQIYLCASTSVIKINDQPAPNRCTAIYVEDSHFEGLFGITNGVLSAGQGFMYVQNCYFENCVSAMDTTVIGAMTISNSWFAPAPGTTIPTPWPSSWDSISNRNEVTYYPNRLQIGLSVDSISSSAGQGLEIQNNGVLTAKFDANQAFLLATTTNTDTARLVVNGGVLTVSTFQSALTSAVNQIIFRNPNGAVGSIVTNGTATAYNMASDYRLKNNQSPLTNSGNFIDALEPKTWEWATDGTKGVGFIAHEVQKISPLSVTGEKDALDKNGQPVMQAMEYGSAEFIANIIAELQSLRKRVAELEAK